MLVTEIFPWASVSHVTLPCFFQGRALGPVAHMTPLRRTSIGDFHISEAWGLEEFQEAVHASRLRGPQEPIEKHAAEADQPKDTNAEVCSVAELDSSGSKTSSMLRALQVLKRIWEKWTSRF